MTMRSNRRALGWALALALCAPVAGAQPTTSPADAARALYVEGKELRRTGDLARSLEKLEAAHALYATPVTALEAARGHALLGRYKKATALLESIPALPVKPSESQKGADARAEGAALVPQYREHLATLRVRAEPETARVLVDGDEVAADARAAFVVDPGVHHLVAELGEQRTTQDVRVGDGETKAVSLTLQAPAVPPTPTPVVAPPPPAPIAAAPSPAVVPHETTPPPARGTSPLAYVGFGVAAVGTVVGTVTGIMTLSRASTLKDQCNAQGACLPDAHVGTAQTLGTVSTISFVAAGGGLLLGVGALLFDASPPDAPRSALRVSPWLGAGSAGIGGTFQ